MSEGQSVEHHRAIGVTQAESSVRHSVSTERLRAAFEGMAVGMILKGAEGETLESNPALRRMLGYGEEELKGMTRSDYTHPEDAGRDAELYSQLLAGERDSFRMEKRYVRNDGSVMWGRLSVSRIEGAEGEPAFAVGVVEDITELKRAEETLKESEGRFRHLFEHSSDALLVHDEQGRMVDCNLEACRSLGYTREELLELSVEDIATDVLSEEEKKARGADTPWARAMNPQSGTAVGFHENEHRRKDDTTFPVEVGISAIDYGGRRLIFASCRDLTERKQAEKVLKQSEERYRAVVEQTIEGIYLGVADTKRILESNAAFQKMLGYTAEELRGMHIYDFIDHDQENIDSVFQSVLDKGHHLIGERRYRRKDDSIVDVETSATVVSYDSKEVLCTVVRDITERKKTEEALKESEERYRTVVEQSAESIWLFDPDTKQVLESNTRFQKMLGYTAEELRSMTNYDFVAHNREDIDSAVERVVQERRGFFGERKYRCKDGTVLDVEVSGTVIPYKGKEVVCGVARDLTERKRAEEALRRSESSLAAAQRIAHLGNWDYDITNDEARWSDEMYRIFGFAPRQFVPRYRTFLNSVHPDDKDLIRRSVRKALYEEEQGSVDYRIVRPDGEVRIVQSHYEVIRQLSNRAVKLVGTVHDITEHREAEERRREAEERYHTLVETVPAVTYTDRAVGSYPNMALYTSPQIEALVGYSVEEWLDPERDLWEESLHPEDRAWVLATDEDSKATGEPFAEEYRLLAKDGSVVWVRDEAALMRDEAGEPLYWQGVLVDVTEHKEAEEALGRSERHFRVLTQNSSDVVTLLRATGAIRYQSPSVERILGYGQEEMVGDNAFDYVHPDDLERVEMAFAEGLVDPGRRPSVEYRFRHKDGSWVWLESVGTNLLGDPGVGEYVVTSRDVTERKRAEEALKEAEERYRNVVEEQTELVCRFLPDLTLSFVNDAYCRYFGQTPRELIGNSFLGHIPEEDQPHYEGELFALSRENSTRRVEHRVFTSDGEVRWMQWTDTAIFDGEGRIIEYQFVGRDVTEQKVLEERLEHQAFHDSLTDLPNRQLFVDRLGQALRRTRRRDNQVAVLFMDLDEFKVVNDSLGHEAGDLLLTVVAQRLRRCLRPEDTLARFGGDEFVVLIEAVDDPAQTIQVAERIKDELRRPFIMEGRELYVAASIGISLGHARTHDPDGLLREADTAMYRAKEEGSGYKVFDPDMYERALGRLEMEHDLRRAIEQEEFVVHYQPIVNLQTGELWGMEALVRWDHPERGLLDPDEFVPVAEESGLVVPMGELVLQEACRRAAEWQRVFPCTPPLAMSVNLSGRQLRRPDLHEVIGQALEESGLPASSLGLDITETVYISALDANTAALDRLKALGIRISLDDFGSGYSSLSYLKRLPADILKIDKSFMKGLGVEVEDTAIVQTVVDLAHILGMEVIAEGVEIEEQKTLLKEMGCDFAQGYHFSKPLPSHEVSRFLSG